MQRPEWMQTGYLAGGAVVSALVCLLVRADSLAATVAQAVFMWGFAAYGLWSMRDLLAVVTETGGDVASWWRRRRAAAAPPPPPPPLPAVPADAQARVQRVVATMAAHGLFQPEVPDAALLSGVLALRGWPAQPDSIVLALDGLAAYQAGADPARWTGNLLVEDTHAEQFEDALERQVQDVVQLAGGALVVDGLHIDVRPASDDSRRCAVRVRMRVQGQPLKLAYTGDLKQLSTHIQHALAQRLAALATGRRLAWLNMGEQLVLSVLADGAVEALNEALGLGPDGPCHWAWVDAEPPQAAGTD